MTTLEVGALCLVMGLRQRRYQQEKYVRPGPLGPGLKPTNPFPRAYLFTVRGQRAVRLQPGWDLNWEPRGES